MGFIDCIRRMVSDIEIQDKISHQMKDYKHKCGVFSKKMAVRQWETKQPRAHLARLSTRSFDCL
uniref:Uncharacterized protein n=1 Tax=Nelumbo nucifera TaxID=4432 RepID=A0A822YFK4_NELNU|nr:TPA_asm: hypothetical protein HUJ06_031244 [Nelumbo nucifera]